jgi:hypothetical protein
VSVAVYSHVRRIAWLFRAKVLGVFSPAGYFDESGIHADSQVIVVAGYVSPERDWRRLEIKWNKILKEEGIPQYHTKDIEADPPRGIYEGWTRARADKLTDRIVPIAAKWAGRACGVHIPASFWFRAIPFARFLPNETHWAAYYLLAKACIDVFIDAHSKESSEKVAFVFARNQYSAGLIDGFEIAREMHPSANLIGAIGTDPDIEHNPMLQAGDLIAWHYRRNVEIRRGFRDEAPHRAVPILLDPSKTHIFRAFDEKLFTAQITALLDQRGEEWSRLAWAKIAEEDRKREERKKRGEQWRRENTR